MPASTSISLRDPAGASITCGASRNGAAADPANFAPNSPKVRCSLRFSIRENAAASQNAVDPPLPSSTS
jgi:hypothetical protein